MTALIIMPVVLTTKTNIIYCFRQNRMNRKNLKAGNQSLVMGITHEDYYLTDRTTNCLDLFLEVRK